MLAVNPGDVVRVLRASIALRDKIVVLRLAGDALGGDRAAAFAEPIAALRASGARPLVVCDPADGAGPLSVLGPALALVNALAAQGQQGVALSATCALGVHVLPIVPPEVVPIVNPVVVVHLQTLAYVPILVLPVADQTGAAAAISGDTVAAMLARALEAAALVLPRGAEIPPPQEGGPRVLAIDMARPELLLSELFLAVTSSSPSSAS